MLQFNSDDVAPARQLAAPSPVGDSSGGGTDAESLLQTLPWGVVVLDAHGTVLRLNQQAAYWWGAPAQALQGQRLGPATAGTLPADLQRALCEIPGNEPAPSGEFFLPQQQQWITMASARKASEWIVYWQDITAQKEQERQNQARQAASDTLVRRTEAVAGIGSYEVELATGNFHFSDGLFQLFGEVPGAFTPDLSFINARSHPDDVAVVQQVLAQAIANCQPYSYQQRIYRADGQLRTLEAHGRVECDALGQPVKLLGLLQDVTEREQAAQELLRVRDELAQRAAASYSTLYNSMDEGFCVLEVLFDEAQRPVDYRFLDVNPAFEKQTGLYRALGKTIGELVPAIEPRWADVYGRVSSSGEPMRFEANVESMSRWFDINAFPIGPLTDRRVAVLFTDITGRKLAEEALRESEDQLRQAVGLAHLGICHWEYQQDLMRGNDERFLMLGLDPAPGVLSGAQAIALTHPDDREIWASIRQQVEAHGEFQASYRIVRPDNQAVRWLSEVGRVVEWQHEQPVRISSVLLDITLQYEAAEALRQSEEQFRLLLAATSDTVYRMGPDWTQMEPLIGKDFLTSTPDPTRAWLEAYIPAEDLAQVQVAIAEAIQHKSTFELEHRVQRADGTVGWTHSRAIPILGVGDELTGWLGAASDVSARRQAAAQLLEFNVRLEQQVAERTQALRESQARLQSVFDSTTIGVALLRAIRDAAGHILDFEYVLVNPVTQAYYGGQGLVGQRQHARHPLAGNSAGLFERFRAVVETGRRTDFELLDDREGYNHWLRLVGVKLGDGLLYTAEDITARKLLERAQAESFALLRASEEVASMGSWDYNLTTQTLTWSDGLYRLLGRPVGSAVEPQLFLDFVLDDDRPRAALLLRTLATGRRSFNESLRLRVGTVVKTVRFKAGPLDPAVEPPVRVLGVCLDVSDVQRLEDENLALKLSRHKELLLAILQAQEDERRRLAEVLHNSLGQVLYATKLHLDQLDTPALHALPTLASLHQQTGRLLAEAMRQTRTLAHELVPTSLAEFGLAVALRNICRDLSTPQLRLECQVWGEEDELPQPVQVALFRLAQELAHNIVRHAEATQALLELETLPTWVSLRAEDNGRGFDPQTAAEGLGLRTVRDAVALLGGTVAIDSTPRFGTHIRLRIPLPLFS